MNESGTFVLGLVLLVLLAVWIGIRLPGEYRGRQRPSAATVGVVWTLCAVHFALVVLAAVRPTWRLSLPAGVAVGGGALLIGLGTAIYLSAVFVFGFRRQSGLDTGRLVTEGVYGWSRNPILLGWTLVLVGLGLVRGSGMILFLAILLAAGYRLTLPLEEELLRRLYGEDYERYRSRTHRYLGRRGRSTADDE